MDPRLEKTPKRDEAQEKDEKSFLPQNCEPDPSTAVGAGIGCSLRKRNIFIAQHQKCIHF